MVYVHYDDCAEFHKMLMRQKQLILTYITWGPFYAKKFLMKLKECYIINKIYSTTFLLKSLISALQPREVHNFWESRAAAASKLLTSAKNVYNKFCRKLDDLSFLLSTFSCKVSSKRGTQPTFILGSMDPMEKCSQTFNEMHKSLWTIPTSIITITNLTTSNFWNSCNISNCPREKQT